MVHLLKLDWETEIQKIIRFIQEIVSSSKADGVVVGLSGGIDSSVVAAICAEALGSTKVIGILLPSSFTPSEDIADAASLASKLRIHTYTVRIDSIVDLTLKEGQMPGNRMSRGNLSARARMALLYYFANATNRLVAGTSDRSESLIGYFTKFGDGAADFLPIVHLYKTQVRELGRELGLSDSIVNKPSAPRLWKDHQASHELPVAYPILDQILHCLFDLSMEPDMVARELRLSRTVVNKVVSLCASSRHKRELPRSLMPSSPLPPRQK